MPKAFKACLAKHPHRVRTIKRDKNHYQHICYSNGKSAAGEVKRKKKERK